MTWPYGAKYQGTYDADKRVSGVYTYPDGRTYTGTCLNERPDNGIEKTSDGLFIGEWINGKFMTEESEDI